MKRVLSFAAASDRPRRHHRGHRRAEKEFNIAWTIYVAGCHGPTPRDGIVKKWADKYGITITSRQINTTSNRSTSTGGKIRRVTVTKCTH